MGNRVHSVWSSFLQSSDNQNDILKASNFTEECEPDPFEDPWQETFASSANDYKEPEITTAHITDGVSESQSPKSSVNLQNSEDIGFTTGQPLASSQGEPEQESPGATKYWKLPDECDAQSSVSSKSTKWFAMKGTQLRVKLAEQDKSKATRGKNNLSTNSPKPASLGSSPKPSSDTTCDVVVLPCENSSAVTDTTYLKAAEFLAEDAREKLSYTEVKTALTEAKLSNLENCTNTVETTLTTVESTVTRSSQGRTAGTQAMLSETNEKALPEAKLSFELCKTGTETDTCKTGTETSEKAVLETGIAALPPSSQISQEATEEPIYQHIATETLEDEAMFAVSGKGETESSIDKEDTRHPKSNLSVSMQQYQSTLPATHQLCSLRLNEVRHTDAIWAEADSFSKKNFLEQESGGSCKENLESMPLLLQKTLTKTPKHGRSPNLGRLTTEICKSPRTPTTNRSAKSVMTSPSQVDKSSEINDLVRPQTRRVAKNGKGSCSDSFIRSPENPQSPSQAAPKPNKSVTTGKGRSSKTPSKVRSQISSSRTLPQLLSLRSADDKNTVKTYDAHPDNVLHRSKQKKGSSCDISHTSQSTWSKVPVASDSSVLQAPSTHRSTTTRKSPELDSSLKSIPSSPIQTTSMTSRWHNLRSSKVKEAAWSSLDNLDSLLMGTRALKQKDNSSSDLEPPMQLRCKSSPAIPHNNSPEKTASHVSARTPSGTPKTAMTSLCESPRTPMHVTSNAMLQGQSPKTVLSTNVSSKTPSSDPQGMVMLSSPNTNGATLPKGFPEEASRQTLESLKAMTTTKQKSPRTQVVSTRVVKRSPQIKSPKALEQRSPRTPGTSSPSVKSSPRSQEGSAAVMQNYSSDAVSTSVSELQGKTTVGTSPKTTSSPAEHMSPPRPEVLDSDSRSPKSSVSKQKSPITCVTSHKMLRWSPRLVDLQCSGTSSSPRSEMPKLGLTRTSDSHKSPKVHNSEAVSPQSADRLKRKLLRTVTSPKVTQQSPRFVDSPVRTNFVSPKTHGSLETNTNSPETSGSTNSRPVQHNRSRSPEATNTSQQKTPATHVLQKSPRFAASAETEQRSPWTPESPEPQIVKKASLQIGDSCQSPKVNIDSKASKLLDRQKSPKVKVDSKSPEASNMAMQDLSTTSVSSIKILPRSPRFIASPIKPKVRSPKPNYQMAISPTTESQSPENTATSMSSPAIEKETSDFLTRITRSSSKITMSPTKTRQTYPSQGDEKLAKLKSKSLSCDMLQTPPMMSSHRICSPTPTTVARLSQDDAGSILQDMIATIGTSNSPRDVRQPAAAEKIGRPVQAKMVRKPAKRFDCPSAEK